MLSEVQQNDPALPSRLRPEVPPALDAICLRCLAREPRERYPSGAELAKDLRRFLAGVPLKATPDATLEPVPRNIPDELRSQTSVAAEASRRSVWARLMRWITRHPHM